MEKIEEENQPSLPSRPEKYYFVLYNCQPDPIFPNDARKSDGVYTAKERYFGEVDPESRFKENLGMTLVPDKYSPGEYFIHHGLYFNSRFNGLGCAYSLKFKYTGFFKEGLKHGKGQFLKYDSSESYIGNFKNNNVYGFGVIKRALQSDSHNFIPITDPIGQDSENRLEVSKHSKETKQSTNGVFHYVVTGYFHKSFHPSGFGSIVKLQNNRVFKGFLHNGLPSKIGSFFKNGVLVYTGEFGEIDPKTKLSLYKDGQF